MIELPIKKGQKFLSGDETGEVVSITRKNSRCVVWIGEISGDIRLFHSDGKVDCGRVDNYDLQPIPVKIEEGVEFSGEQYRAEFERLVAEGREFEIEIPNTSYWTPSSAFESTHTYRLLPQKIIIPEGEPFRITSLDMRNECLRLQNEEGRVFECSGNRPDGGFLFVNFCVEYILLPQHRDANGNPLKVGDRVECRGGMRMKIASIENGMVIDAKYNSENIEHCRLLKTVTRPLCAADLDKAPCPMFLTNDDGRTRVNIDWDERGVFLYAGSYPQEWNQLKDYQWRPSADQPWQTCEVTDEVLA